MATPQRSQTPALKSLKRSSLTRKALKRKPYTVTRQGRSEAAYTFTYTAGYVIFGEESMSIASWFHFRNHCSAVNTAMVKNVEYRHFWREGNKGDYELVVTNDPLDLENKGLVQIKLHNQADCVRAGPLPPKLVNIVSIQYRDWREVSRVFSKIDKAIQKDYFYMELETVKKRLRYLETETETANMWFSLNTTTRDYGGLPMEESSGEASPPGGESNDENTPSTDGGETDATNDELEISLSPVPGDDNAIAYVTPQNAEKEPESHAEKEPESHAGFTDESEHFIRNLRKILLHLIEAQLVKSWKAECYGCEVDHPSQIQHSCLERYPEYFFHTLGEKRLPELWNARFIPAVEAYLATQGVVLPRQQVIGAVEALLYVFTQEDDLNAVIQDMTDSLIDEKSFLDEALDVWEGNNS